MSIGVNGIILPKPTLCHSPSPFACRLSQHQGLSEEGSSLHQSGVQIIKTMVIGVSLKAKMSKNQLPSSYNCWQNSVGLCSVTLSQSLLVSSFWACRLMGQQREFVSRMASTLGYSIIKVISHHLCHIPQGTEASHRSVHTPGERLHEAGIMEVI